MNLSRGSNSSIVRLITIAATGIAGIASGPLLTNEAVAAQAGPGAIRWAFASGKAVRLPWAVQSRWTFPEAKHKAPLLRTWIRLPADVIPLKIQSKAIGHRFRPGDSPFDTDHVLRVDTHERGGRFRIRVRTRKNRTFDLVGTIVPRPGSHGIWADESCRDEDVTLLPARANAGAGGKSPGVLYAGARCEWNGGDLRLRLYTPKGVSIRNAPKGMLQESDGSHSFPLSGLEQGRAAARIRLTKGRDAMTEVVVTHSLPEPASRLRLQAGTAMSYVRYQQNPGAIQVAQMGLVVRAGARYLMIPDWLDASLDGHVTALAMGMPAGELPPARFYGFAGRLGYRLPVTARSGTDWRVHAGWRYLGMSVQDSQYGFLALTGPQLMFEVRPPDSPRNRPFFTYVKWTQVADGTFSLENREFAAGAGLALARYGFWRKPLLTLDVSSTAYRAGTRNLGMLSVSLGAAVTF